MFSSFDLDFPFDLTAKVDELFKDHPSGVVENTEYKVALADFKENMNNAFNNLQAKVENIIAAHAGNRDTRRGSLQHFKLNRQFCLASLFNILIPF